MSNNQNQPPVSAEERKLNDDIRKAEKQRDTRLSVEFVDVVSSGKIPDKELMARLAPKTQPTFGVDRTGKKIRIAPEEHGFTGDAKLHDQYIHDGYIPVKEGSGVHARTSAGDLLYTLDKTLHDRKKNLPVERAKQRINDPIKEQADGHGVVTEEIGAVTVGG